MAEEPSAEMVRQAAFWSAELATDEATDADRAACDAWCAEHPLRQLAMSRMRGLDLQLGGAQAPERKAIDSLLAPPVRGGGAKAAVLLGIAALVAIGWGAAGSWTVRSHFPAAVTGKGELRTVSVADGSLHLDTDSAMDVTAEQGGTHVSLYRGRVLARVRPHRTAPFVVETPEGTASALGTAFTVERNAGRTIVTVIASHVRACAAQSSPCIDLALGARAVMEDSGIRTLASVTPAQAAAWSEGWLIADDRPVAAVLAEINRYRGIPVAFDAQALAGVRVSGSLALSDTDRALDGIARVTGLSLTRHGRSAALAPR